MDPTPTTSDPPDGPRPALATAIVGAGHVGGVLAVALADAGWPIRAVVSRDAERRERVAAAVGASLAAGPTADAPTDRPTDALVPTADAPTIGHVADADLPTHGPTDALGSADVRRVAALADVADLREDITLVLLTVPDDAIAEVARRVPARPGRAIVHTSGVHPASILRPAVPPDMPVGSIHPLVAFAEPARALEALRGAAMAIDGDPGLVPTLTWLVEAVGGRPIALPPDAKAAWHAAAVLSAGGVVALIDVIDELAAVAGLDPTTAHEVFQPLMRQAIANTGVLGTRTALTGPVVRGDGGTIAAHLAVIEERAPATGEVYRALLRRQASLAGRTTTTDPEVDPRPAP